MKAFLTELFEYNHHCNQQLVDLLIQNKEQVSEKAVKLFSHILNAQHIWNCRILGNPNRFGVWDMHEHGEIKKIDEDNYANSIAIVGQRDLNTVISYLNTKGQAFDNKVIDILFHSINHATYHRGQIATEFRQSGIEPLITDYIFYKR